MDFYWVPNLTSDSTAIGNWKEEQFIYSIRQGKYNGVASDRDIMPPMPWTMYRNMTDDELNHIRLPEINQTNQKCGAAPGSSHIKVDAGFLQTAKYLKFILCSSKLA